MANALRGKTTEGGRQRHGSTPTFPSTSTSTYSHDNNNDKVNT